MSAEDDFTTLQARLKKAREMAGHTTKSLSAALLSDWSIEASDAQVSRIENGTARPSFAYMAAVARMGRVSLDWIAWGRLDRGRAGDVIARLRRELDKLEDEYVVDLGEPIRLPESLSAKPDALPGEIALGVEPDPGQPRQRGKRKAGGHQGPQP